MSLKYELQQKLDKLEGYGMDARAPAGDPRVTELKRQLAALHQGRGYEYFSTTGSGWTVSTDPDAAPDKVWRAVHPALGERFFAEHGQILQFTTSMAAELVRSILRPARPAN
jgi:hypothetical protein